MTRTSPNNKNKKKNSETANLHQADDPTKFLQLALYCSCKNSVKIFLDPDRDTDQHRNRMAFCQFHKMS